MRFLPTQLDPCPCGDPSCDVRLIANDPLLSPKRLLDAWLSWMYYRREGVKVGSPLRFLRFHRRELARVMVEGEDYGRA